MGGGSSASPGLGLRAVLVQYILCLRCLLYVLVQVCTWHYRARNDTVDTTLERAPPYIRELRGASPIWPRKGCVSAILAYRSGTVVDGFIGTIKTLLM